MIYVQIVLNFPIWLYSEVCFQLTSFTTWSAGSSKIIRIEIGESGMIYWFWETLESCCFLLMYVYLKSRVEGEIANQNMLIIKSLPIFFLQYLTTVLEIEKFAMHHHDAYRKRERESEMNSCEDNNISK